MFFANVEDAGIDFMDVPSKVSLWKENLRWRILWYHDFAFSCYFEDVSN